MMMCGEEYTMHAYVLRKLQCHVCRKMCTPPVKMCRAAHIICDACYSYRPSCRNCHQPMFVRRILLTENVSTKVKQTCKNLPMGCEEKLYFDEIGNHEETCPYRTFNCQVVYINMNSDMVCKWRGVLPALHSHVQRKHPTQFKVSSFPMKYEQTCVFVMDSPSPQKYSQLICAEGQYFWFKQVYHPLYKEVRFSVVFVGAEERASCFNYKVVMGHSEMCSLTFNSDTVHVCNNETTGHICTLSEYYFNIFSRQGLLLFTLYLDKKCVIA